MSEITAVHQNSTMMNPLIKKISRINESDQHAASYKGIAVKTLIFMLAAVAGVILYFVMNVALTGSGTLEIAGYTFYQTEALVCFVALILSAFAPMLAFVIRPLIPDLWYLILRLRRL